MVGARASRSMSAGIRAMRAGRRLQDASQRVRESILRQDDPRTVLARMRHRDRVARLRLTLADRARGFGRAEIRIRAILAR